jgi:hypothetical protein
MRPIAGRRSLPTAAHLERCRPNWDSIAVLTLHAKILTRIQGGSTAKLRTWKFFSAQSRPVLLDETDRRRIAREGLRAAPNWTKTAEA